MMAPFAPPSGSSETSALSQYTVVPKRAIPSASDCPDTSATGVPPERGIW
jgi:hypothetical protein